MRLWHKCFPMNFVKFLRTPFLTEHLWWLLLKFQFHTWLSHPPKLKSMLIDSRNNLLFVSGFCPSSVSVLVLQPVTTIHRMCQVWKTCYNTLISILTNCLYGMSSEKYISFMMLSTLWRTFEIICEIISFIISAYFSFIQVLWFQRSHQRSRWRNKMEFFSWHSREVSYYSIRLTISHSGREYFAIFHQINFSNIHAAYMSQLDNVFVTVH